MLTITVRTYRPGDEPTVRKGGAVLPSSNAVSEAAQHYDDATIRDFVPILVERDAREELRE